MRNEAKTLLDSGNLSGATEAALKLVKANPTDISARTFLFELACFSGDWTRAERQLDAIGHQDVNAAVGSLIYRQCIEVEKKRGQVQDQIRQLEERFRSLGPNGMSSVSPIEKQASQMNDKATAMEAQSTALHRKWNAIDQSMNDLRPKIDAWKAKNLR